MRTPRGLPLTALKLTRLLPLVMSMPIWLAPVDRTPLTSCPPPPAINQPMVPFCASAPMIVSLPELDRVHTGNWLLAAVTRPTVHCVIVSDFAPPRTTFSIVLAKMQITAPLLALLYACCTVGTPPDPTVMVQTADGFSGQLVVPRLPKSLPVEVLFNPIVSL